MAITKDIGRQHVLSAEIEFDFKTIETDLVVQTAKVLAAFDIPPNSIVIGGEVVITAAFVGPTAASLDVGDTADDDRYTSTIINLLNAQRTPLTATGFKYTEWDTVDFTVTTTVAVATAGAGYVRLEYITLGRETENV